MTTVEETVLHDVAGLVLYQDRVLLSTVTIINAKFNQRETVQVMHVLGHLPRQAESGQPTNLIFMCCFPATTFTRVAMVKVSICSTHSSTRRRV